MQTPTKSTTSSLNCLNGATILDQKLSRTITWAFRALPISTLSNFPPETFARFVQARDQAVEPANIPPIQLAALQIGFAVLDLVGKLLKQKPNLPRYFPLRAIKRYAKQVQIIVDEKLLEGFRNLQQVGEIDARTGALLWEKTQQQYSAISLILPQAAPKKRSPPSLDARVQRVAEELESQGDQEAKRLASNIRNYLSAKRARQPKPCSDQENQQAS